jgi:hypothetical protein
MFPHGAPGSLDIHPNGRRITYTVSENEIEVWAMDRLSSTPPPTR